MRERRGERGDREKSEEREGVNDATATCSICLGNMASLKRRGIGREELSALGMATQPYDAHPTEHLAVVETPCRHRYHTRCILAAVDAGCDSCPVCRCPLLQAYENEQL